MIILPERNVPRARLLMPVAAREWRQPSQRSATFGIENRTRFRITARLDDGHVVWSGWFDDRADFDAFLWALASGSLQYERELWRLPTPWWSPDLGEELSYQFLTNVSLTSGAGSNQAYTSASDWDNAHNNIHTIGGGGSGAGTSSGSNTGGGGGAWNTIANFSFATPGTTTATWRAGLGGVGLTNGTNTSGHDGGDSWFNGTTLGGSSVGSKGGSGGVRTASGSSPGGAGGVGASGVGTSSNNGGRGGNYVPGSISRTGAGGAAGPNGAGVNGVDTVTIENGNGGAGDAGSGGIAGVTSSGAPPGNGTEWDATHGSGGGSGANNNGGTINNGGNYGGGGGGASGPSGAGSGSGAQGIAQLIYTPLSTIKMRKTLSGLGTRIGSRQIHRAA